MMIRRTLFAYAAIMFFLIISIMGTASAALGGTAYTEIVGRQSMYTVSVATMRGTIYDRNLEPLTNSGEKLVAAVVPNVDSVARLYAATDGEKREELRLALESEKPFLIEVNTPISDENIETFTVYDRYEEAQPAANLIGYLQNEHGADGIEWSYDAALSGKAGHIDVTFAIDAAGGAISGEAMRIENDYIMSDGGIVLTLDRAIQIAVEEACSEIERGAAVVLDTKSGAVLASASFPAVDPDNLAANLEDENAPFLNRAMSCYTPGSVFKLFAAAAALENGYDYRAVYTCEGRIDVDGMEFSCYNNTAHGEVNMHTALRKSCNGYFIHLLQEIGPEPVLEMLRKVGFGTSLELASNLTTDTGSLSSETELQYLRALANFSFGQGDTTISPVQLAAAVNAIASGGVYTRPFVYLGIADVNLETIRGELPEGEKVMEVTTANRIIAYMKSTARYGTARFGAPQNCTSGIKTGTAQTGIYNEDGEEVLNYWYAGFICDQTETPKYTVVLLEESAGQSHTAAAFKKIGEFLGDFI